MSENDFRKHFPESFTVKRKKYNRNYKMTDDERITICRLFEKKFEFTNYSEPWYLPQIEMIYRDDIWKIMELQAVKEELNAVKSKLNDFDLEDWHKHTRSTSKTGDVLWKLKSEFDPEFVTQAWCKFYECAMSFLLVPQTAIELQNFNSVHLCEAPGAFITSLNHFLKLHYPEVKWHWKATTLNPYYEGNPLSSMINDDRFIFQTLPYWTFGYDYSGDIMNMNNVNHLVDEMKQLGDIHLVTADGSIDCQDNPGEQECVVSSLHYFETIAALSILAEGGSFLLKIFTTHEAQTVCLLFLLCCVFQQVSLFKPATSKEGNSEVYVVCLKYKGKIHVEPWLKKMKDCNGPEYAGKIMFPLECISQNFIEQLLSCSIIYKNIQIDAMERNIKDYGISSNNYNIKRMKHLTAHHFMLHYRMQRLTDEREEIVGKLKLKKAISTNLDSYIRKGSFHDKMEQKCSGFKERLLALYEELQEWEITWPTISDLKWFKLQSPVTELKVVVGKPVNTIHCSKFCSRYLLKIWHDVREATVGFFPSTSTKKCIADELHTRYGSEELVDVLSKNNSDVITNLKTVSIETDYWNSLQGDTNESAEKATFRKILDTVSKMQKGENMLLTGYPLLTQFNVGIIYLLANLFEKIGFVNIVKQGYGIVLVKFEASDNKVLGFLNDVGQMCAEYKKKGDEISVLSVVTITKLCGKHTHFIQREDHSLEPKGNHSREEDEIEEIEDNVAFCYHVTEMNNRFLKERMSELICKYLQDET